MKNVSTFCFLGIGVSIFVACSETSNNTGTPKPSGSTQVGTSSTGSSSQPAASAPADLVSIPTGHSFVVSCAKTIKIPTTNNPITAQSEAGMNAAIVLAELSQKGGVKICSEYWANSDDREKAFLIEDRTADCELKNMVVAADVSLKTACPTPQTGSQSLSKSSDKVYFRSSMYISGATAEQLKKLSAGWSELGMSTAGAETKRTDDLR
ncbi:MAG: hypothetical protein ACO3A4_05760 [Silvanigrellaceae bacterium]